MSMEERPVDAPDNAVPPRQHGSATARDRGAAFFSTPELRQRLDLLRHLTDNSEKILLIKGVSGSGKSTLLQQFRHLSRDEWMLCCLNADPMLQPDQFFALLFRRFGLTDTTPLNIDELIKRFEMLQAAGRLPVIVVDDAHLLPVATLIALFRLFERRPGSRALIRVVLFATPEITRQFQTPQLQAMNLQSLQSLEMPLFDRAQAQAFIGFLLNMEGRQQELQVASGRIERIIKESAGLPGGLEAQLQHAFALAPKRIEKTAPGTVENVSGAARTILSDLPVSVLVGAPLLALLLLLTLVFQDEINGLFDQTKTGPGTENPQTLAKGGLQPLKLPESDSSLLRDEKSAPLPAEPARPLEEAPAVTDVPIDDMALPETGSRTMDEPQPVDTPPGDTPEADPAPAAVTQPLPVEAGNAPPDNESGSVDPQFAEMADTPADLDAPEGGAEDATAVIPEAVQADSAPPSDRSVNSADGPAASAKPAVKKGIRDQKWILTQKPSAYTLQLVAVRDEVAARRFIQQHQLSGDIGYFKTTRSDQVWYAVIYGVFADRSAAIQGRERLPPALRKSDAWPRTYASIREAVAR